MSKLTNLAKNALADFLRGQGITLPSSWYIGLLTDFDDDTYTEVTGIDYDRVEVVRSLSAWSGTQGASTTLPSTGTSHQTSNNEIVDFGAAGSAWGTVTHIGLFDDDGELWMVAELASPLVINDSDPVYFSAGSIVFTLGLSGGMSDYLANKMIDLLFRGQSFSWPSTTYLGLMTAAPSNAGGGAEVSGGGYARVALPSTMTAISGTQGPDTTDPSDGTSGRISNNITLQFPPVVGDWGTVGWVEQRDAAAGGNLLFWRPLAQAKTISAGGASPKFEPDTYGITFA